MSTSLPLLLLLVCPLLVVRMMRGLHGGGDRTGSGHGAAVDRYEPHSSDGQSTDARIEQPEREIASLRSAPASWGEVPIDAVDLILL